MVAVPPEAWDTWRNTSVPLMCSRDCASVLVIAKGHRVPTSPSPHSPSQNLPIQIFFFLKSTFIFLIGILQTQSLPQGAGMFAFKKAFLFPTNFFKYKFCWHGWMSCHVPPVTCLASPVPGLGVRGRRGSNAASCQQ